MHSKVALPFRPRWRTLSPLCAYGLTLAAAAPLLLLALHTVSPLTPLGYIVLPMLAGLVLPLCMILYIRPARASATISHGFLDDDLLITETIAADMQISDNAERVAGMAE